MGSRELILGRLRQRPERPFPTALPPASYRPMVPLADASPAALQARFVDEAEKAAAVVHQAHSPAEGIAAILGLVAEDKAVSSWEPAHIPIPGWAEALDAAGIARVAQDAAARVGITGVDAALAATGSVVVASGRGRYRAASLLPPVHIAVVDAGQIVPDLESWLAAQKAAGLAPRRTSGQAQTRQRSNIVVITGPSRTADIAMQLVMGMHGPRELHVLLLTF